MNIKETIRRVLKEGVKEKMIEFIDESGVITAAKFVGGYKELKNIVGEDLISRGEKVHIIMDYIGETAFEGISLFEVDGPILYKDYDDEIHQIEYLSQVRAIVNVYSGYKYETIDGEYGINYESLPDNILEQIFEIIMDKIL